MFQAVLPYGFYWRYCLRLRIFSSVFGTTTFSDRTGVTLIPPIPYASSSCSVHYYYYYYYYYYCTATTTTTTTALLLLLHYYYYCYLQLPDRQLSKQADNSRRFDIFAVVLLRIRVFWDRTLCLWVSGSRCFEG
jgi:hypothetical protein